MPKFQRLRVLKQRVVMSLEEKLLARTNYLGAAALRVSLRKNISTIQAQRIVAGFIKRQQYKKV